MKIVTVRVKPGARVESVREEHGLVFISTPAHPEHGKANHEVIKLLAAHLKVAPSLLRIVRGSTSRTKMVEVYEAR
jgi:uncharacterized protein YggU (UPF0235/DUF167 family)